MMKTQFNLSLFSQTLGLIISIYFTPILTIEGAPYNYDKVKTTLNKYVNAIDFLDKDEADAKASLLNNPDDVTPALMLIFAESSDERHRGAILDVFSHAATTQAEIAAFLVNQLKAPANEWQGKHWIRSTIDLLVKIDHAKARMIAIKALDSLNLEIQVSGIQALGKCGTNEDISHLRLYARNRRSTNSTHQEDELTAEAKAAEIRIGKQ